MRRGRVPRSRVSQERWLVSYADFITLLFGFFVVLYAFSKADHKKQVQVADSIDIAFKSLGLFADSSHRPGAASTRSGTDQPVIPMNIVMGEEVMSPARVKDDLEHIRKELTQTLSNQVAQHSVSIHMGRDGLVISLREAGFFSSGSAAPSQQCLTTLAPIAASLARSPFDLRVEGHTDNVPIHTARYDSNWELSAARATGIARSLITHFKVPPERISAAGYGEFHPADTNDTAEGRAANRRVDLVILPRSKIDLSAPPPPVKQGEWHRLADLDSGGQPAKSEPGKE